MVAALARLAIVLPRGAREVEAEGRRQLQIRDERTSQGGREEGRNAHGTGTGSAVSCGRYKGFRVTTNGYTIFRGCFRKYACSYYHLS